MHYFILICIFEQAIQNHLDFIIVNSKGKHQFLQVHFYHFFYGLSTFSPKTSSFIDLVVLFSLKLFSLLIYYRVFEAEADVLD
jgi:hypothetical protein